MKKLIIVIILLSSLKGFSQWFGVNSNTTEHINNIFFIDENVGYCVGGGDIYGFPDGNGVVLKTTDRGENWETIFSQIDLSIQSVAVIESNIYCFARLSGTPYLVFSDNDGENWSIEQINYYPLDVNATNTSIFFKDDIDNFNLKKIENNIITTLAENIGLFGVNGNEIVYVNGDFNTIYKSVDFGETWITLDNYPDNFSGNQSSNAYIKSFGDNITIKGTYPSYIYHSNDNGVSWEYVELFEEYDVGYLTILTSNIIIGNWADGILATEDLGNTWVQQLDINDVQFRKFYFYNTNLGFAVGENGIIYKTENSGGLGFADNTDVEQKIKVFPNPTKNIIKLEVSQGVLIKKIQLYNIQGKLIKSYKKNNRELMVCDVSVGNYILKIKTDKGIVVTKKIVIE